MAKITYTNKEAINIDPSIPAKNKCMADDLNEIKNVVNENENKTLISISSIAPSQCTTGDLYFNTTSKKIFTATATDTWSSTGEDPTENTLYLYDNTIYSYDGTTLVAVGGGIEIAISTTQPSGDEVVWINPSEIVNPSSIFVSNEYSTANDKSYSCEYINDLAIGGYTYSTSETDTGKKWIDNKTIYRKIITKDGEHSSSLVSINLGMKVDFLVDATIIWESANGGVITVNGAQISINKGTTVSALQTTLPSTPVYNIKVIIEYTKG